MIPFPLILSLEFLFEELESTHKPQSLNLHHSLYLQLANNLNYWVLNCTIISLKLTLAIKLGSKI